MRTGLVRCYGEKDTVEEYIDIAVRHFRRSKRVRDTAVKYYYYIAKQPKPINDLYKSMLAMTVVFLAAKVHDEGIPSNRWSGEHSCSYNTLLKHAIDIKKVLDESDQFPNLRYIRIGR